MASAKRSRPLEHHDRNLTNKRPRPSQPVYNSAAYDDHAQAYNNTNRPPQRSHHGPVHTQAHSPDDLQTSLVSLLDAFGAAETTSNADRELLHRVHELRALLCARKHTARAQVKRELDEKRPDKVSRVRIPNHVERQIAAAKALPPLPPIREPHLHEAVFTHRSANSKPGQAQQPQDILLDLDYERLELLGDAYIELIASRALYNRFPQVDVPELCSWRERLVENSTLGKFSEAYGFPERLKHQSHWDHNSRAWRKVVADIFEAYVAALVLSDPKHGFEMAESWLTELWAPQLLGFKAKIVENLKAKEELQRLVFLKDIKLDYRQEKPMTYDSGSIQHFYVGVYLTGWGYEDEWLGSGEGQNKHQAAVAAASSAIKNSAAVKAAAKLKAEVLEARRIAKEEAEAAEKAEPTVIVPEPEPQGADESSSEAKKKKKHKKSKKEKE